LSGEVLEVRFEEKTIAEARLMDTASIALFGNSQISSQACRAVLGRDIPIFYLSYGGWLSGFARSIDSHSLDLRIAQHHVSDNARLKISRAIVEGKVRNQRTMIRRLAGPRGKRVLQALAICIARVAKASALDELLGLEGRAARLYFEMFATLLAEGTFDFKSRTRRPPTDPINAMLSFGYAMLVKEALAAVIATGFEPNLGMYHGIRPGRPSLALDLMEEFRPLIVDSTVLSLVNTGEIRPSHFIRRGIGTNLTDDGRRVFIKAFERRLNATILHPTFGYEASYRRSLWLQARLLARTIQSELDQYQPFVTR
jgi:CRISPR-associated protein Cas1